MIYDYKCNKCNAVFEVIKTMAEVSKEESCPLCSHEHTTRVFSSNLHFIGAKVKDAYYNHGLGCVIKSDRQKNNLVKENGLIEVGNEKPDTIYKETVEKKQAERDREWKEL